VGVWYSCGKHSFKTRPGPRPEFQVLIESSSRTGQFFLNQNNIVLVKKKTKVNEFATGSCRVNPPGHTGFFLFPFFLQPCPVPVPGWPGPGSTRQAGPSFKTRGVQNNRLTEKTDKTEEKLTEKTKPKWKTDC